MYHYKVVPFIGHLKEGLFSSENADKVSADLEALLNKTAGVGWEFYRIDDVQIKVARGCLIGGQSSVVRFDQIIFRRLVDGA